MSKTQKQTGDLMRTVPSGPTGAAYRREELIAFWHLKDPRIAPRSIAECMAVWDPIEFNRICSEKLRQLAEDL